MEKYVASFAIDRIAPMCYEHLNSFNPSRKVAFFVINIQSTGLRGYFPTRWLASSNRSCHCAACCRPRNISWLHRTMAYVLPLRLEGPTSFQTRRCDVYPGIPRNISSTSTMGPGSLVWPCHALYHDGPPSLLSPSGGRE
ncbi:helix-turn-helix, Fis-type [Anopheles sinensis]|uniref:Helix-turn-helix, Fis-type n=1 Tax=Anopheles sinensis TaxID=74873 RepID=A0A084WUX4_ANOSI|nr:helix-turn-helix, Fis-type [Anopheles sinensis]